MSYSRIAVGFFVALLCTLQATPFSPVQAASERTIQFSGRTWTVRDTGRSGPGPNIWDSSERSVFVDPLGQLHLKIVNTDGAWSSSEVYLPSSLGYGTYTFEVTSRVDQLDTNVVASPFIYETDTREFDIEFANWKAEGNDRGQFVVQPGYIPGQGFVETNISRYPLDITDGITTHTMTWTPDHVAFSSKQGDRIISEWMYTGANNFEPGGEKVHINLWMYEGTPPSDGREQEFIIKSFDFTPLGAPVPITAPTPAPEPPPISAPEPEITPDPIIEPTSTTPDETVYAAPEPVLGGKKPKHFFIRIPYTDYALSCKYRTHRFAHYPYVYHEPRCKVTGL